MENFDWEAVFQMPFEITRDTILQSLQFYILHRIYPCNKWLSRWEADATELCAKCDQIDTLQHHFYSCMLVKSLWNSFENWWRYSMDETIILTDIDVIFGFFKETKYDKALNLCILIAKQFIANYKYSNMRPSLYVLLLKIMEYIQVEKYICARNNRLQDFEALEKLYEAL